MNKIILNLITTLLLTSAVASADTPANDPANPGNITLNCKISEKGFEKDLAGVWDGDPYAMIETPNYASEAFPDYTIGASLSGYNVGKRTVMIFLSTKAGTMVATQMDEKSATLSIGINGNTDLSVTCKSSN